MIYSKSFTLYVIYTYDAGYKEFIVKFLQTSNPPSLRVGYVFFINNNINKRIFDRIEYSKTKYKWF